MFCSHKSRKSRDDRQTDRVRRMHTNLNFGVGFLESRKNVLGQSINFLWVQVRTYLIQVSTSLRFQTFIGIPMGTNCAPLVADLFLFCNERDFMLSLSDNN